MTFLLDTNVVSEWVKPRPDPNVVGWFAQADEERVFLSVVTFAEIGRGIELLADGRRRRDLRDWLADDLPARFDGRILLVDRAVAEGWGVLMARSRALGANVGAMDGFVAATAAVHRLTLVTRNVGHFHRPGRTAAQSLAAGRLKHGGVPPTIRGATHAPPPRSAPRHTAGR